MCLTEKHILIRLNDQFVKEVVSLCSEFFQSDFSMLLSFPTVQGYDTDSGLIQILAIELGVFFGVNKNNGGFNAKEKFLESKKLLRFFHHNHVAFPAVPGWQQSFLQVLPI